MMQHSNNPPECLKNSVKALAQQPTLNKDQLNGLLNLQDDVLGEEHETTKQKAAKSSFTLWIQSIAATFVIAFGVFFWLAQPNNNYSEEIAYEVVKNHLKLKPLDIHTQSIGDIQTFFTQLDFSPVNSIFLEKSVGLSNSFMLGGRYCSIKGVTAAQLRYQKDTLSTFYQVPYDAELHGYIPSPAHEESPELLEIKGLNVQLWQEKGLLMVLVGQ